MIVLWIGFIALIIGLLALDLGVFHRRPHAIGMREALGWSAFWIGIGLAWTLVVYQMYERAWFGVGAELSGRQASLEYLGAYLVEKSLSLDNVFVFAVIFTHFRIPPELQHRVLFWGIIGALVLRGSMIAVGLGALARFDWIVYVFGALLLFTAMRMLRRPGHARDPHEGTLVKLAWRLLPLTRQMNGARFTIDVDGRRLLTPLALVLILIEMSDVLFAIDSIPAVFAVTRDPFLVFTSNVFAILGLRALYFALSGVIQKFRFVKLSLAVILGYVGVKMLLSHHYLIPTAVSLAVISGVLTLGILSSMLTTQERPRTG